MLRQVGPEFTEIMPRLYILPDKGDITLILIIITMEMIIVFYVPVLPNCFRQKQLCFVTTAS